MKNFMNKNKKNDMKEGFYTVNGVYYDSPYYRRPFFYPSWQDKYLYAYANYHYDPHSKYNYYHHHVDGIVHPHHTHSHVHPVDIDHPSINHLHTHNTHSPLLNSATYSTAIPPRIHTRNIVHKTVQPKYILTTNNKTYYKTYPKYTPRSRWYWHGVMDKKNG